jgi:hypothetical protein
MGPKALAIVLVAGIMISMAGPASSQCVDPPEGLISWWTADGTPDDLLGNNDGTLEGGMAFAVGKVILAFEFDGVDDYVDAGNDPSVRPDFPISVDFWMYKDTTDDFYGIASTDTGGNGLYSGFRVYVNAAGAVVTGIGNNLGCCAADFRRNFFSPDGVITLHTWHHVAVVFESATSHLIYVDGAPQATTMGGLATTMAYGAGNRLQIGRVFNPNMDAFQYGNGQIDEVELHTGIMDPAKILEIFNAGAEGKCRNSPIATDATSWGTVKATFRNP